MSELSKLEIERWMFFHAHANLYLLSAFVAQKRILLALLPGEHWRLNLGFACRFYFFAFHDFLWLFWLSFFLFNKHHWHFCDCLFAGLATFRDWDTLCIDTEFPLIRLSSCPYFLWKCTLAKHICYVGWRVNWCHLLYRLHSIGKAWELNIAFFCVLF